MAKKKPADLTYDLTCASRRWVKNVIFRKCTRASSQKVIPRWEQDYQLQAMSKLGLFYEYLEMGEHKRRGPKRASAV